MATKTVKLMMPFEEIDAPHGKLVGGKGLALAQMTRSGLRVPPGAVILTSTYARFTEGTGLGERISLELSRKDFADMRWEELWDAALRIRNMFLTTPIPDSLAEELQTQFPSHLVENPVAIRSSAPAEDSSAASFAGLHESYVNVRGIDEILKHVRLVWASLWSDRALLYRQELGLDVSQSSMGVVVQQMVTGRCSGVVFSRNPSDRSQVVIEAVYGLNQGLVDGDIEPDRWMLERSSVRTVSHAAPARDRKCVPAQTGVAYEPLLPEEKAHPPLDQKGLKEVYDLALRAEEHFRSPQDVEWTFRGDELYVLQSRPITRGTGEVADDDRAWYLSLRRTFENLKSLRRTVEGERLPAMDAEARLLSEQNIQGFTDADLAHEIERRRKIYDRWHDIYWEEFIPLAHGVRLFGEVYNDLMEPEDPFEFTRLLGDTGMISVERNKALQQLASRLRNNRDLLDEIRQGKTEPRGEFADAIDLFLERFELPQLNAGDNRRPLLNLLCEMAERDAATENSTPTDPQKLREEFLSSFPDGQEDYARGLLELGRASYRLRDNDNIYLGAIEKQWQRAVREGEKRLSARGLNNVDAFSAIQVERALRGEKVDFGGFEATQNQGKDPDVSPRQVRGQPAGPGVTTGVARVIRSQEDIFDVQSNEIIVCDAIDPNMTFIVPVASAVVERRGGMLIHGAIIAREYGLPCVTGVPDATSLIQSGDRITVDGHLGIVVIHRPSPPISPESLPISTIRKSSSPSS